MVYIYLLWLVDRVPSSDEMNAMHNGGMGAAKTTTSTSATPASGAQPQAPTQAPPPAGHDAEANVSGVEAIYVRNASKSYGVGKRRAQVLRSLDMNVKKGTMYVVVTFFNDLSVNCWRFHLSSHLYFINYLILSILLIVS